MEEINGTQLSINVSATYVTTDNTEDPLTEESTNQNNNLTSIPEEYVTEDELRIWIGSLSEQLKAEYNEKFVNLDNYLDYLKQVISSTSSLVENEKKSILNIVNTKHELIKQTIDVLDSKVEAYNEELVNKILSTNKTISDVLKNSENVYKYTINKVSECKEYVLQMNLLIASNNADLITLLNYIKEALLNASATTEWETGIELRVGELEKVIKLFDTTESLNFSPNGIVRIPFPRKPARIDFTELYSHYWDAAYVAGTKCEFVYNNYWRHLNLRTVCRKKSTVGIDLYKNQNMVKGLMKYDDGDGNVFTKTVWMAAQGDSSMSFIKKNFAIELYKDVPEELYTQDSDLLLYLNYDDIYKDTCSYNIAFGNWIDTNEFHLKACSDDSTCCINKSAYDFAENFIQMTNSRSSRNWKSTDPNTTLMNSTSMDDDYNFGNNALCHPDSFPVEIYCEGVYYGLYQLLLKKEAANYNLTPNDGDYVLLDGTLSTSTFFSANASSIDWTKFSIKSPKKILDTSPGKDPDTKKLKTCVPNESYKYSATQYYESAYKYDRDNPSELFGAENINDLYDKNVIDDNDNTSTNLIKSRYKKTIGGVKQITDARYGGWRSIWLETALTKKAIQTVATAASVVADMPISGATEEESEQLLQAAKTEFEKTYDVESLMTYFFVTQVLYHYDGYAKNWIWTVHSNGYGDDATYKACPNLYDMNAVFGRYYKGTHVLYKPTNGLLGVSTSNTSTWRALPTSLLYRLYFKEIVSRYKEYRNNGVLSTKSVLSYLKKNINFVGKDAIERNLNAWPETASHRVSNINSEYWELIGSDRSDLNEYNAETTYNVGDVVYLLRNTDYIWDFSKSSDHIAAPYISHATWDKPYCKCIKQCTGQPLFLTDESLIYNSYPSAGGFVESLERIEKWLDGRFEWLDKKLSYTPETAGRSLSEIDKLIGDVDGITTVTKSIQVTANEYISGSGNMIYANIKKGDEYSIKYVDDEGLIDYANAIVYLREVDESHTSKYVDTHLTPNVIHNRIATNDLEGLCISTSTERPYDVIKNGIIEVTVTYSKPNTITTQIKDLSNNIDNLSKEFTTLVEGSDINDSFEYDTIAGQRVSSKNAYVLTLINKNVEYTILIDITADGMSEGTVVLKNTALWVNELALSSGKHAIQSGITLKTGSNVFVYTSTDAIKYIGVGIDLANDVLYNVHMKCTVTAHNPSIAGGSKTIEELYSNLISRAALLGSHRYLTANDSWTDGFVNPIYKKANLIQPLLFAHISDTHSNSSNSKDNIDRTVLILNGLYTNSKSTRSGVKNVKFLLHTGDIYPNDKSNGTVYFSSIAKAKLPVYQVIGNHDVGAPSSLGNDSKYNTTLQAYDTITSVVIPEANRTGKCYYYNDFTPERIRLIVLYDFDNDTENGKVPSGIHRGVRLYSKLQLLWFCETLLSVPTGYGVIIATHMPHDFRGTDENNFNVDIMWNLSSPYIETRMSTTSYVPFYDYIPTIVDYWKRGVKCDESTDYIANLDTGVTRKIQLKDDNDLYYDFSTKNANTEFICYCNGHTHSDGISRLKNHSDLLELNIGCNNYHYQHFSDALNVYGGNMLDLINIYSIDRNKGLIYVLRIGNSTTSMGVERDHLTISYR